MGATVDWAVKRVSSLVFNAEIWLYRSPGDCDASSLCAYENALPEALDFLLIVFSKGGRNGFDTIDLTPDHGVENFKFSTRTWSALASCLTIEHWLCFA